MSDPQLDAPYLRHQQTAETLLRTVQEALNPVFDAKGSVSREELARIIERITAMSDRTGALFAQACRACVAEPVSPVVRMAMFDPRGRRKDYATRLLFSHVIDRLPEQLDPLTGASYPRVLAASLQSALSGLFYDVEWRAMNSDAMTAFQKIGTTRDGEIRERIDRDAALPIVVGSVFARVLLRFRQFTYQRQAFTRRMADQLRAQRFLFTEDHFVAVFHALAERLRDEVKGEFARTRFDMRHGEGTAAALLRIFDEFDTHRRAIEARRPSPASMSRPVGMSRRLVAGSRL